MKHISILSKIIITLLSVFFLFTNNFRVQSYSYFHESVYYNNLKEIVLKDGNCKDIFTLPINTFLSNQHKYGFFADPISCLSNNNDIKYYPVQILGTLYSDVYGYAPISDLVFGGSLVGSNNFPRTSMDTKKQIAKLTITTALRDEDCKKIGVVYKSQIVEVNIKTYTERLCSINGNLFRMIEIKDGDNTGFVSLIDIR